MQPILAAAIDIWTLAAASIAAGASIWAAVKSSGTAKELQAQEHTYQDSTRFQGPRIELYTKFLDLLLGADTIPDLEHNRSGSSLDPEAITRWIDEHWMEQAKEWNRRSIEANQLRGRIRLHATADVREAAAYATNTLSEHSKAWNQILILRMSDDYPEGVEAVFEEHIEPTRMFLNENADLFEEAVRQELRIDSHRDSPP